MTKERAAYYRQYAIEKKIKLYAWVNEYKSQRGCKCCPEKDPICLTFHHINPNQKSGKVSAIIATLHTWKAVQAEIAKCEVICFNCHAKLHRDHPNLKKSGLGTGSPKG